jgi:chromosome segregation ATPase
VFPFAIFAQLDQMKLEIHSVSAKAQKDAYNAKIASFRTRVAAAKKALLFSGSAAAAAGGSANMGSLAQRQQTQEDRRAAQLETLKKANAQLAETEAVGINTVNELAKQGEQIKKTRDNVDEVNQNLNHSNKLLNKMSQWWRG